MLIVTAVTVIVPEVGRREMSPLRFPSQITLAGWNLENSEPLVDEPETELSLHRLRSGQEYEYQQGDNEIAIALRLYSPTFGNVESYVRRIYGSSHREAYREGEDRYLSGIGNYRVFHDEETAYLTACVAPEGESTVSVSDYVNQTNATVFSPQGVIPRVLAQRSLRERRCLWVHLSTPLQGESPEAREEVLEEAFEEGFPKWQRLF
ncbi:cyanoexosortase A system-associated protein [Euhalothece natronophila Z-M001]|uniref:Cyanoexosortase A system-associated protein n=1 Tax=Euhalothece natronophila Z-M001 TaxID=522448 RepID=A0A5B8NQC1_9CHRO|nr:cyanoexosortase A system-associated protein [Euhalothece natronophila]QDZ41234.1 cyanoexosortase A system-associated protein [Euhalothece natronophila Z-M001]